MIWCKGNNYFNPTIKKWLIYYKDYYRKKLYVDKPKWDRIYITTLFTFHWKKTIETIIFAKNLVKDTKQIKIGGVLATVLADEVEKETGIFTHKGLLNKAGIFDDNNLVIDELPLDYSILDEIDYKYPENNAYYGYMTRGCIRECPFCAVWKIEPDFNHFISYFDKYKYIKENFGDQRNLLLLDNNVLASKRFPDIIDEIKKTLGQTPPELAADIVERGIVMTGGGSLLKGLPKLIGKETGVPVILAEDPLLCVANGAGKYFELIKDAASTKTIYNYLNS